MRLKLTSLIFLFLTFFFGFLFIKPAFADTYTLTGHISNSSGTAINDATVDVIDTVTNANVGTTTTNGGDYALTIVGGTYNVQVTPPSGSGFSSVIALAQVISTNTTLNFILTPVTGFGTVRGHVSGPLNNSLPNQTVQIGSNSVTTDTDGNYSLQASLGANTLSVSVPWSTSRSNPFDSNAPQVYMIQAGLNVTQDVILNIKLPAKRVTVHVQDQSGNPIQGISLQTSPAGLDAQSFTSRGNLDIGGGIINASGGSFYGLSGLPQPQTDSSGVATLWLFPNNVTDYPGLYSITATPPSGSNYQVTTLSNITITGDTDQTITMTPLPQKVTLHGHLFDALGQTLPNQRIMLNNNASSTTVTSDQDGNYSLQVPIGNYGLKIFLPFSTAASNPFTVSAPQIYTIEASLSLSQDRELDITIPAKKVRVHVQGPSGEAVTGVLLKTSPVGFDYLTYTSRSNLDIGGGITNASGNSFYGQSGLPQPQTDSSGVATLWLFPNNVTDYPGLYSIIATPPTGGDYQPATLSNITITGDTDLTITLPQLPKIINFNGYVYDALNHSLPNQKITLSNNVFSATFVTDSSGAFSYQVPAGNYNLKIFIPFSTAASNPFTVSAPQIYTIEAGISLNQDTNVSYTIPAKKVSLHIQDQFGNPVSGIAIKTSPVGFDYLTYTSRSNLDIGGGITSASGNSFYGQSGLPQPQTDSSGNVSLWLLPNNVTDYPGLYSIIATPPTGSAFAAFTLNNLTVVNDMTEVISLQYNHATPTTTIDLQTQHQDQTYSDPTTVTLSAAAASGYTVANTYYTVDGGSQQIYSAPFTVTGNGSHTVRYWSVDNSGVQEIHNTKTFTISERYAITGTVYNDANQNGFQDQGETGVSGVTVSLNSGQSTTTDSNGNYTFTGLQPATYVEAVTVPNGDVATTTNPVTISLSANTTENFGIASAAPTLVTAIDAGGNTQGNYVADTDFSGGSQYTSSATVDTSGVDNPAPQAVYQSVRYGNSFSYTIPGLTPGGTYSVRLHFNELYWGTSLAGNSGGEGSRVFNVAINGTQVLSNYDIYAKAGGSNISTTEQFPATPDNNGNITIDFTTVTDNAMVNGIDVYSGTLPSPTPTPTPTPVISEAINVGGNATSSFITDAYHSGGITYSSSASVDTSGVTNPAPEAVYQSVRYGNFSYIIPTYSSHTSYHVRLHFNELYWTSAGSRVFNVTINGTQVLSNYDIFAAAGGANKAIVEDFDTTTDATGKIHISFDTVTDNAMVSGIEISKN